MSNDMRKVGPRLWEAPPPNTTPAATGPGLVGQLIRWGWSYRVEWAVFWFCWYLALIVLTDGARKGSIMVAIVLAPLLGIGPVRRWIVRCLRRSRLRRQFMRSCRHAGLANHNDRVPVPIGMTRVPVGDVIRVRLAKGSHAGELEERVDALAAVMQAREVRVTRDATNARYAEVTVVRHDPLGGAKVLVWSCLSALRMSLWRPFPVGLGEHGSPVEICLVERNVLLGGEPGGGKSTILQLIVAAGALDPTVKLSLFDGKRGVELGEWEKCCDHFCCTGVDDALKVLGELREDMIDRYAVLKASGRRKVSESDPTLPLRLVVIDELAEYTAGVDRKASAEFSSLLRDLVSKGRAAGIVVVVATQKPSSDIVPTALRDLFAFRWALRCTTPQASDTILGQGWASQGYSAATVDPASRGVGFLLHEGGWPVRLKGYYLSDSDVARLARRAEQLRGVGVVGDDGAPSAVPGEVVADG